MTVVKPHKSRRWKLPRADQAGVFAAAAGVAMTFQRSLVPRDTKDQAIVTGGTMALMYLMSSLAYDSVESVVSWALVGGSKRKADDDTLRRMTLVSSVAGIAGGLALQRSFPQKPNEQLTAAAARTVGFWMTAGSFAGFVAGAMEESLDALNERSGLKYHLDKVPVAPLGGTVFAAVREYQRRKKEASVTGAPQSTALQISGPKAIAMGGAIGGGSLSLMFANRALSRILGRALDRLLPGDERLWRPMAHVILLGALGAAVYAQWLRTMHGIESGTGKIEAAFDEAPTSDLVSGSKNSLISWDTMGREGRRHTFTVLKAATIESIMGEPAIEPVRVFVGLDSAPSEEERVELAIRELDRTGAFNRKLLIVTSPTGTGYVNYVAVESAEYMTRGDCATVTLQYSKRPSPVSLDRVWEGRKQFRMLLAAIRRRLYKMAPEDRPKLVVFGESLGAHTSQDAFLNSGTQGLQDAGVERALWIGTPHLSKWKVQVFGGDRPDVDRALIGEFNSFDEVEDLPAEDRRQLRYFLVTHGNDGVGRFGLDLLIQHPDWLSDDVELRPVGVPKTEKWITPTTFFQTLIDMKNAMNVVPGQFDANGHDYRADLARFVREAWDLECTDDQLERIETALRRYELLRQGWMEARPGTEVHADGAHAG